jgi:hypothetical protein
MAGTSGTQVNYLSRDFETLRQDLINWARITHPDKFTYFNDASPDVMYLEMCAYVGDMLSYYIDRTFNESFLSTAQAAESLTRIAKDLGFFDTGSTPSTTQIQVTCNVPFKVDPLTSVVAPDSDYLVVIKAGMMLQSNNGINFEVLEDINFADTTNRIVVPNVDSNNQVVDYTITKTVIAIAGETRIQRYYITDTQAQPFLTITLDDQDITEIVGIAGVAGNQYVAPIDESFFDLNTSWFEVRGLSQETQFVELNPTQQSQQLIASYIDPVVKVGTTVPISKRFIVRRDVNGLVSLTFGSSSTSYSAFNNVVQTSTISNTSTLNQILNNTILGEIPKPNTTLFIKYRVLGGDQTNVIAGQITNILNKVFQPAPSGADLTVLSKVRSSLTATNLIPALGGKDAPSKEEIKMIAGKIFSAQDRAVTYEDVKALIDTMPAQFGRPYRVSYEEIKPRVANFQQVENGVNTLLTELLAETTTIGRTLKAQEITTFLANLRTGTAQYDSTNVPSSLDAVSLALLGATPTLWIGEKARLYLVGLSSDGKLLTAFKDNNGIWLSPNELLKGNIKEFLRNKRVIGDWIDIVDARVVNITVEFTVLVDKKNKQAVLLDCLNKMQDYFNINNWQINQPIMLSNVSTILQEINGVVNVVDLKIYNIFGLGNNSVDPISGRQYAPFETGRYRNNNPTPAVPTNNKYLMNAPNNIIIGYPDSIFEVKFATSDIVGKAL